MSHKHELPRDPELERALRRLEGDPPLEAVDWERLRRRVVVGADPALARLRARSRWWDYAARWGRIAIPIAAAAAIAVALMTPQGVEAERSDLESAYLSGAPAAEAVDQLVGAVDRDWLLGEVLGASPQ